MHEHPASLPNATTPAKKPSKRAELSSPDSVVQFLVGLIAASFLIGLGILVGQRLSQNWIGVIVGGGIALLPMCMCAIGLGSDQKLRGLCVGLWVGIALTGGAAIWLAIFIQQVF